MPGMDIGTRLDKAMQDAKVESQSQLARSSGVPQATISRILKGQGKQGPETSTLVALADALGVEIRWLQQGLGPQHRIRGAKEDEHHQTGAEDGPDVRIVPPAAATKLQWVTDREAELLSEYRACAEPQRERILVAARGMPKDARRSAASKKA
jgi:transcriptional regulator with XRE-family HTH domain